MINADHTIVLAVILVVGLFDGDYRSLGDDGQDGAVALVVDAELIGIAPLILNDDDCSGSLVRGSDCPQDENLALVVSLNEEVRERDL